MELTLCVPYDIFHIGGVNQAPELPADAGDAERLHGAERRRRHRLVDPGLLWRWTLPWAKDGIGFAAGIERRVEAQQ
jgi:hypothetical protein